LLSRVSFFTSAFPTRLTSAFRPSFSRATARRVLERVKDSDLSRHPAVMVAEATYVVLLLTESSLGGTAISRRFTTLARRKFVGPRNFGLSWVYQQI
jgi:hypothetical protein